MANVVACRATADYRLWLRFDDGLEGSVFLGGLLEIGAFRFWRDPREFVRVYIEDRTVVWPAGVRLDPEVLYQELEKSGGKRHKPTALDASFERFMQAALAPIRRKRKGRGKEA